VGVYAFLFVTTVYLIWVTRLFFVVNKKMDCKELVNCSRNMHGHSLHSPLWWYGAQSEHLSSTRTMSRILTIGIWIDISMVDLTNMVNHYDAIAIQSQQLYLHAPTKQLVSTFRQSAGWKDSKIDRWWCMLNLEASRWRPPLLDVARELTCIVVLWGSVGWWKISYYIVKG
jgi:hypothetical protein